MKSHLNYTLEDIHLLANELIKMAFKSKVIAFTGNLGAGKTTLIRELLSVLSDEEFLGSPTFSLVNEYQSRDGEALYHFDFYRIKKEVEALDIGFEEYIQKQGAWVFIEWPERIENLLPEHFLLVDIKHEEIGRSIQWKMF